MFSKTCEYGLRACVYIAINSVNGSRLGIKEIAKGIDSPMYFTGKILQALVKADLVGSAKGPHGGFFLDPEAEPVSIFKILGALDCDDFFHKCAFGLSKCSDEHPCPMHKEFKPYKDGLRRLFERTTIQDLAKSIKEGDGYINDLKLETLQGAN